MTWFSREEDFVATTNRMVVLFTLMMACAIRCPKCPGRMLLARIEPGPAHSDLRTFECPKCEHVQRVLVEDPMKSAKAGWQDSWLYPPN